ncbi:MULTISPECIES: urease accessory UreF family protein [Ramlibacter]|nr:MULTISPECIES: urease accessory UreF family protein [Ramlibacter]
MSTAPTPAADAALLQLIWLASPALPVGGFSYSEGLEAAVDHGRVHDEASAAEWLSHQLRITLARADLAVVGEAVQAWRNQDLDRIAALNDWVLHTRETAELRLQAEQMGRSMLEWLKSLGRAVPGAREGGSTMPLTYPLAFAFAASGTLAAPRQAMLAFAFGWAENMGQAAIKAVPLGQGSGQRILMRLAAEIPPAVDAALALAPGERQSFAPMLAILSARHETQYSRLFRS